MRYGPATTRGASDYGRSVKNPGADLHIEIWRSYRHTLLMFRVEIIARVP